MNTSANKLRWGIIGPGSIAPAFARGVAQSASSELVAVASRSLERAQTFAAQFGVPVAHGDYDALIADPGVDAVYIATPHPMHRDVALRASRAGKHLLVEKPMGIDVRETEDIIAAARDAGVFLMEAFMYRCHPQTAKLVELIVQKTIGDILIVNATFSYHCVFNDASRIWNRDLAGGGILDVGVYPISMARLIAGAATGQPFADPIGLKGCGITHPKTRVDCWATAALEFDTGMTANIATGVAVAQENIVRIFGSAGCITLPDPWLFNRDGRQDGRIVIETPDGSDTLDIPHPRLSYADEVDTCAAAIFAGQTEAPAMSWADSLGNACVAASWRATFR